MDLTEFCFCGRFLASSTATIRGQCSLPDINRDHPWPVFPAGHQPRPSVASVPCRTSTARQKICQIERQKECQKIYQKECQKRCQKECQKRCQKECQGDCQKECQKAFQKICRKHCQKICQIERQKECQKICTCAVTAKWQEAKCRISTEPRHMLASSNLLQLHLVFLPKAATAESPVRVAKLLDHDNLKLSLCLLLL